MRNLVFGTSRHDTRTSLGLLAMRLFAGGAMMLHGWPKIQNAGSWMGPEAPVPAFLQFLAAFSEFFGGLAWILGLMTPLASFGILCTMTVAVHFHAVMRGDPFIAKEGPSYELAALYWVIALILMLAGSGKISLDAKISHR